MSTSSPNNPSSILCLDATLIIDILSELAPPDLIACASVCRLFNEIIVDSLRLQVILRHHLYQTTHKDDARTDISSLDDRNRERQFPPDIALHRLVTRETNLDQLTPRVTSFDIPKDQLLHSISGKCIVTQPGEDSDTTTKSGRHILCTVWTDGKPKRVTVDFVPFTDLFELDIQQDVVVVQEEEYGLDRTKTNVHLRFVHLFNETEEAMPREVGYLRIREKDWQRGEPHNISLAPNRKVMMWCDGIVRIYDWRDGTYVGRLPPARLTHPSFFWESNLGMVWVDSKTVIGLDLPHGDDSIIDSSLAVFDIEDIRKQDSPVPLLLELPFNRDKLPQLVRQLVRLPSETSTITFSDEEPYIQREGPYRLLVTSSEFVIDDSQEMRLVVVLLTDSIDQLRALRERKRRSNGRPHRSNLAGDHRVWELEDDPFQTIDRLSFDEWKHKSMVWVEPKKSRSWFQGFYEAQHGLRLLDYDLLELQHNGNLKLTMFDYNQRKLRWEHLNDGQSVTLGGGKGGVAPKTVAQSEQKAGKNRRQPSNYEKIVIAPTADQLGSVKISGEFSLGQKGRAKTFIFEGQRIAVQQQDHGKIWLFDFGAIDTDSEESEAEGSSTAGEGEGEDVEMSSETAVQPGQRRGWWNQK
nr:uncharacterized protein CI109_001358 [Kwoniella shandongensis]KAA5530554.1 hypothetical protein CI109_001358 [Kwoniella shandongensis]